MPYIKYVTSDPSVLTKMNATVQQVAKAKEYATMQEYADENDMIEMPCVIEFKYAAEDIIRDLSSDIKFFNDMDLLVCWDLDEQKFANNSIEVDQIEKFIEDFRAGK